MRAGGAKNKHIFLFWLQTFQGGSIMMMYPFSLKPDPSYSSEPVSSAECVCVYYRIPRIIAIASQAKLKLKYGVSDGTVMVPNNNNKYSSNVGSF